jgi:hypothetical protein
MVRFLALFRRLITTSEVTTEPPKRSIQRELEENWPNGTAD